MDEDSDSKKRSRGDNDDIDNDEPVPKKVLDKSNMSDSQSSEPEVIERDDSGIHEDAHAEESSTPRGLDVLSMFVMNEDLHTLECDDRYGSYVYDSRSKSSFRLLPKHSLAAAVMNSKTARIALEEAKSVLEAAEQLEESIRNGNQSISFKRIVVDGIDKITTESVVVTLYQKRSDEQPLLTYHLNNWVPTITLQDE